MKTNNFYRSLETINAFCSTSSQGFIIVEVNDIIMKQELIDELSTRFDVNICMLDDLSKNKGNRNNNAILIVDAMFSNNDEKVAVNLNYNRDWFLSLNCNIVFILTSSMVDRLISFSYSFWSFVSLHLRLEDKFYCILEPQFIEESFEFESSEDLKRDRIITKILSKSYPSPTKIVSNIINENLTFANNNELEQYIKDLLISNIDNKQKVFEKVLALADAFYENDYLNKAEVCYCELYKFSLTFFSQHEYLIIVERLARISYKQEKYNSAKFYYNRLLECSDVNFDDIKTIDNSDINIARVLNNLGCSLYKMKDYDLALSCFNNGVKVLNNQPSTIQLCELLYNLSLISYTTDDFNNAIYYIDCAINMLEQNGVSRIYYILESHYNTLKAYLLIKHGQVKKAIELLDKSLHMLRNELKEEHAYIMEIHFVYALANFYFNDLNKALLCANKAYDIARKIKVSRVVKTQICELIGEIYYYSDIYDKAKYYMKKAYKLNKSIQLFSDDVNSWMRQIIKICDSFINEQ